jgi:hypothetical protein
MHQYELLLGLKQLTLGDVLERRLDTTRLPEATVIGNTCHQGSVRKLSDALAASGRG